MHLSNGLLCQDVPVRLNRLILDYDHLLVCGPVFPHEVVGFSGGNKYFFPGIAGADIIDFTHWLGALITSYEIIGTKDTPVRRVIDRAAGFIPRPSHALCSVVTHEGVEGVFGGTVEEAWSAAADLSAQVHIRYVDHPYEQVLSVMPEMYDEIWVGAKGMYKLEPVVADGGELIIYAPHIKAISDVHGALIKQVGYHVRDYFVKQWDQFKHIPWGVLAHSTHLRGVGTFEDGVERPRIQVTLATGIPEAECRAVNLGYRDPATIDPEGWPEADPRRLVVRRAGEYLYRLPSSTH
jgi:nickel-dependent lactate racemase